MDVIRHHDKRDEVVEGADSLAIPNGLRDACGDSWLLEPVRAQRGALESAVRGDESASVAAGSQWEGTMQSKGNKQRCAVGLEMG